MRVRFAAGIQIGIGSKGAPFFQALYQRGAAAPTGGAMIEPVVPYAVAVYLVSPQPAMNSPERKPPILGPHSAPPLSIPQQFYPQLRRK